MGSQQTSFDAFVTKSIKQIANDVRGRTVEARSVRELCADVLGASWAKRHEICLQVETARPDLLCCL